MTAVDKDVDMDFIDPSAGTICPDDYTLAYQGRKYTKYTDSAFGVRHGFLCAAIIAQITVKSPCLSIPTAR